MLLVKRKPSQLFRKGTFQRILTAPVTIINAPELWPDLVAHTCNLGPGQVKAGRSGDLGQLWLQSTFKAELVFMKHCFRQTEKQTNYYYIDT